MHLARRRPLSAFAAVTIALGLVTPGRRAANRTPALRPSPATVGRPLAFEPNVGQAAAGVDFVARTGGATVLLDSCGATLVVREPGRTETRRAVRLAFRGATRVEGEGRGRLPGVANYLHGSDPASWRTHVATFAEVAYPGVYPGVGIVYHGTTNRLEYDFVLAPGARPDVVRIAISGAEAVDLDERGNLVVRAGDAEILQRPPVAYQLDGAARRNVAARYRLRGSEVTIALGDYDHRRALIVDPVLAYSTYFGGSGFDGGSAVAIDGAGNIYFGGSTDSPDFPVTAGALQGAQLSSNDGFVTKLDPTGTTVLWSTYLGGTRDDGVGQLAMTSAGEVIVGGRTSSSDFPVTPGAAQSSGGGAGHVFVTRLTASGASLVFSTYLGGSLGDSPTGMAIDSPGNVYVIGDTHSSDFPTTANAIDRTGPAYFLDIKPFFTKIDATGSAFLYSTYLGAVNDVSGAVASAGADNAVVAIRTAQTGLATTGALQPAPAGGEDVLLGTIDTAGGAFVWATYLGGTLQDSAHGLAVDASGNVWVAGLTDSIDFPVTAGAAQAVHAGMYADAFLARLDAAGTTLRDSTYLGGSDGETGTVALALAPAGDVWLSGATLSNDFPVTADALQASRVGSSDLWVAHFDAALALTFATYLGGSGGELPAGGLGVDASGDLWLTGSTQSADFPVGPGVQTALDGIEDAFVAKIALSPPAPTISNVTPVQGPIGGGTTVTVAGTGFAQGATVAFGGAAATSVVATSATSITGTTPAHPAGAVDVTVANTDLQSATAAGAFTYLEADGGPAGDANDSAEGGLSPVRPTGCGCSVRRNPSTSAVPFLALGLLLVRRRRRAQAGAPIG